MPTRSAASTLPAKSSRKTALSGFFLRITSKTVHLGAGSHGFSREALASYRTALNDEKAAKPLASLAKRLERGGYEVGVETYKKPPRGFNGNPAGQELVLHSALWASVERKSPPELGSAKFVSYCMREWKKLAPIHRWLIESVRG